jgi:N-acetyl-gamma-glutamyl-phosphate reductase
LYRPHGRSLAAATLLLPLTAVVPGGSVWLLQEALAARYADEPFIRVMPLSDPDVLTEGFFDVQACNDTNRCDLFVFANDTQALLLARLDNLGKGASGAAVQCMNLKLGLPEGLSL